jgi:hypothetical protein
MIDGLGPQERALIAAGRDLLGPDAETVARLHAKIGVAIAAPTAGVATAVVVKLALVTAVVGSVSGIIYAHHANRPIPSTLPPPAITVSENAESDLAPRIEVSEREPALAPRLVEHVERPVPRVAIEAPPVEAPPPPPPPVPQIKLVDEIRLVDRASDALRVGNTAAVLAAIATYEAQTGGRGQLAEEAAAIEIEARCKAGDPTARDRLAEFERHWTRSAQRSRLTNACSR